MATSIDPSFGRTASAPRELTTAPGLASGIAGGAAACVVAVLARRAHALSTSGAIAAAGVGWAATLAGTPWAVLLIVYFAATSLLSRWKRQAKADRTGNILEKSGGRDAWQVLANGGLFAVAALAAVLVPNAAPWMAIGAGALAASAADSWGTEIGTASSHAPRSVLTWQRVATGTSGGVSAIGSAGTVAGAAFVGGLCVAVGWPASVGLAAAVAGVAGAWADSLLGATVQARRWCEACGMETEQRVHRCGTRTTHRRGLAWLTNDGVNLMATVVGAVVAWLI